METSASSSYGWALHELGFADFKDERLTKRAVHIAASLLQNPQQSIPSCAGVSTWYTLSAKIYHLQK